MRAHAPQGTPRRPPAPTDRRRTLVLSGLLAATAIVATVAWTTRSDADADANPDADVAASVAADVETAGDAVPELAPPLATAPPAGTDGDGAEPASTTPPASVSLDGTDPGLHAALAAAEDALTEAGLELIVNSGYRTAEHQQRLLDEAITEYGSYEEASRWVFQPQRSMHVQGLAVDIGSGPAADWLQAHGAPFGICRTLEWEWWHFEWRQAWQDRGDCPSPVGEPEDAPGVDVP